MTDKKASKMIYIRLPPELYDKIKALADRDGTKIATMARTLIHRQLHDK